MGLAAEKIEYVCDICGTDAECFESYFFFCRDCNYWFSNLEPDVQNVNAAESEYELISYESTRRKNYLDILKTLSKTYKQGKSLLEIGCADGLFLELAEKHFSYRVTGIEPNTRMMAGNSFGRKIHIGFFPEVLKGKEEKYDMIVLNDTLEHIPNLDVLLPSFKKFLTHEGTVVINVPVSSGLLFPICRLLCWLGIRYPFERIWQKGFVSPHLHYFSTKCIAKFFSKHGLVLWKEQKMCFFSLQGLTARVGLDSKVKWYQKIFAVLALSAYYPVSFLFPDAKVFFFRSR